MQDFLEQLPIIDQIPPEILNIVLPLLTLVVALLLVILLRRVVRFVLLRPLRRLAERTSSTMDDQLVEQLLQPLRYIVIAIAIALSVSILNFGPEIQDLGNRLRFYLQAGRCRRADPQRPATLHRHHRAATAAALHPHRDQSVDRRAGTVDRAPGVGL